MTRRVVMYTGTSMGARRLSLCCYRDQNTHTRRRTYARKHTHAHRLPWHIAHGRHASGHNTYTSLPTQSNTDNYRFSAHRPPSTHRITDVKATPVTAHNTPKPDTHLRQSYVRAQTLVTVPSSQTWHPAPQWFVPMAIGTTEGTQ